jgi:hypothetical protein
VNVGVDHDTSAFAVASIRRWWQDAGRSSAAPAPVREAKPVELAQSSADRAALTPNSAASIDADDRSLPGGNSADSKRSRSRPLPLSAAARVSRVGGCQAARSR